MSARGELEGRGSTSAWPYSVGDTPGFAGVRFVLFVLLFTNCVDIDNLLSFLVDIKIKSPARRLTFKQPDQVVFFDNARTPLVILKLAPGLGPAQILQHAHFSKGLNRCFVSAGQNRRKA